MSILRKLLPVTLAVVVFTGCSTYNKLVKSDDHIAKYNAALEYYKNKKNDKALYLFNAVAPYFSGTEKEDTISFYSAVSNYRMGDFESSGQLLNDFRRKFNRSEFIEEAEYLIAMGYYHSSPKPERDQTSSQKGITAFKEYLDRYPNSHKKEECLKYTDELVQKLYDKSLLNSKVYYHIDYYKSAIHTLKVTLSDYPETNHREEILFLIARSSYLLASNSIPTLQRERYLNTLDAYYNLVSEFPDTKHLKDAKQMYEDTQKFLKKSDSKEEKKDEEKNNL